ncbi:aryl-sulfate sulfotransferase [Nevskia soli]|uniref:aryl-sulfate sulfotransferase n=1 Tax=Nevskia soli TaxID=418856 RepID=UPI0015D685B6|nr:aryl-sulfate sulfotransferase [Nevskia soli]
MRSILHTLAVFTAACPIWASVSITSFAPSLTSPQAIGTPVTFQAKAADSGPGPLAFQFSVSFDGGAYMTVQDFQGSPLEVGAASDTFVWGSALTEGSYSIRLVVEDFVTGSSVTQTSSYTLNSRATGSGLVLTTTSNPVVVLASGPSCAVGSSFSVAYRERGAKSTSYTNPIPCDGVHSMNQYVAGLYQGSTYKMNYAVTTGGQQVSGPAAVTFTSGDFPTKIAFPVSTVITAAGAGSDPSIKNILFSTFAFDADGDVFNPMMTDMSGRMVWYAAIQDPLANGVVSRVIPGGEVMTMRDGNVWNGNGALGKGAKSMGQKVAIIDAAGDLVQSTTTQAVGEALTAQGYPGTTHCSTVPTPVSIGTRCLASFNHEFLQLPDGNLLVLVAQEDIFPPGAQGTNQSCTVSDSTVPCNVDIVANCMVVLNGTTLQPLWFWSPFDHEDANELPITRAAIYTGTTSSPNCSDSGNGCRPVWLAGTTGVTPDANDWLHLNSVYYRASDGNLIISMRHQDWAALVQYQDGTGNGQVLWRLGCSPGLTPPVNPVCGDFTFNNVYNDVYPWFSHQHDVEIDANGDMTMYDNGNTRVYELGNSQNSRGYVISLDEVNKIASPILIQDLGYQSDALGSAQLLPSGDYFFEASDITYASGIRVESHPTHALEVEPTTGESGNIIFDLETSTSYRGFALPNFYDNFDAQ